MSGWKRLAAACAALSLMAAAAPAGAAAQAAEPVRIALVEGMSGPFANAGAAVERNLRFGIERVNARAAA